MARLSLRGITREFTSGAGRVLALDDVWLDVEDGEFVVLLGPSGCGKSTLLNLVAGLDRPDRGEVLENGKAITGPGRDRGVVFQDGALFPWLTAQRNVKFGLKQMGLSPRERAERAGYYLELVQLSRFRNSYMHELSGGMRQRVAIARALALDPELMLMDEPFSALDAQTREDLYVGLQDIWQRTGKTIIFVTHNVREAACLGDRLVLMSPRPGRIHANYPVPLARPRMMDDLEVARIAHEVSSVLKSVATSRPAEEENEPWHHEKSTFSDALAGMLGSSR